MTQRHLAFALLLTSVGLNGCGGERSGGPAEEPSPAASDEGAQATDETTDESTEQMDDVDDEQAHEEAATPPRPPAPPADQAHAFAAANNQFALDFWARVRQTPGNQIVSPASISLALAMTYAGANGETAEQMASTMHFDGLPGETLHEAAGGLLAQWNDPERETYELAVVNRLFGEATYTFEPPFLELTRTQYGAPLEETDFIGAPDPARAHINGWVAEQTHDRIQDLIPAGGITSETRLALVNAVYFLGAWQTPFPRSGTRPEPFHVDGGAPVDVPMMHLTASVQFAETDTLQLVQLPYQGDDLAMVVLVPRQEDGLEAVSAALSPEALDGWINDMQPGRVALAMPRARVAPEASLELSEILREMGMRLPFLAGSADFTRMANPPDSADRLLISAVFHKAFVNIDEQGTEAAAATAVVMRRTGGMPAPPNVTVRADRPYLFLIRDLRSGTILFVGRVVDPR